MQNLTFWEPESKINKKYRKKFQKSKRWDKKNPRNQERKKKAKNSSETQELSIAKGVDIEPLSHHHDLKLHMHT